jgi:hypothetical protein
MFIPIQNHVSPIAEHGQTFLIWEESRLYDSIIF